MKIVQLTALFGGWFAAQALFAVPVTFEDAPLGNPATDGSSEYQSSGTYFWNGSDSSGSFRSGGATFPNRFTDFGGGFTSWSGFAYSNTTDTVTNSFTNQYSSVTGSGAQGSETYGIGFTDPTSTLTFDSPFDFSGGKGLYLTNTTYAALDMQNGSPFSKKFGGASGTDPDWFKVTIQGSNGGAPTGSLDFYLADYRSSSDYILDEWTFVNLSSLGEVDSLGFTIDSSDKGTFGINTPKYFALDNIGAIPEANTFASLILGLGILAAFRRWKP